MNAKTAVLPQIVRHDLALQLGLYLRYLPEATSQIFSE